MDGLFLLGALVVLIFFGSFIGVLVLFARTAGLRARVATLEARLAEAALVAPPRAETAPEARAEVPLAGMPDGMHEEMHAEQHVGLHAELHTEPSTETASQPATEQPAGPWSRPATPAAETGAEPVTEPDLQDRPLVFRRDRFADLAGWLRENWVYVISAISLAFAGVYFVQYGIEKGLLTPWMRVTAALLLGLALAGAGEWLRRRNGPGTLPSGLAGAGLVSAFAGLVAARQLYGLIGPELTFAGLLAIAAAGLLLGWFHGAFLTGFALLGAAAAPFLVGGSAEAPYWLYAYFPLVAAVGLGVDAARRWAWVSVLALALGFGGDLLTSAATGGQGWLALSFLALAVLGVLVPGFALSPRHNGPMIAEAVARNRQQGWPAFPTRLAGGAVAAATVMLVLTQSATAAESVMAYLALAALGVVLALWSARAPALADIALLPALGFLLRLVAEGTAPGPLAWQWFDAATALREPGTSAPMTLWLLLGLATAMTLAFAVGARSGLGRFLHAAAAAITAPAAAVVLELFWAPEATAGAYPFALAVVALAALMAVLAQRFAAADGEDRRRTAYATLACLSLIALALFVTVSAAALTVALGVLVTVAAALDRRFRLPEMGWFIQAGVLALGWRLVIDPGLVWAQEVPVFDLWLHFLGALVGMIAAYRILPAGRNGAQVFLESGIAAGAALFVDVLLFRSFDHSGPGEGFWLASASALPWLVLALVQLYRMSLGGWMRVVRAGLAAVAGLMALVGLAGAALPLSPLVNPGPERLGPPLIDKLFLAYGLPALVLALALPRLGHLPRLLRQGMAALALALAALWAGLEIRRFWHGTDLQLPGVMQGELYSYTLALMALGAGLLAAAVLRRSGLLRRAAMVVIALTIAKVFLIDASGLSGLVRVVSFLGLGLALAGLAGLNRWARTLEGQGRG